MMALSTAAYLMGGVFVAMNLAGVVAPGRVCRGVKAFPRSAWMGRLLTAAALFWVAWIVYHAPLGRFNGYKPALVFVAPLAFFLLITYVDELLAPRALGGLLLLIANPILNIARWNESPYRLVVTCLAYLAVVAGLILVLSPYRFRQALSFWVQSNSRCRSGAVLGIMTGTILIVLALKVY